MKKFIFLKKYFYSHEFPSILFIGFILIGYWTWVDALSYLTFSTLLTFCLLQISAGIFVLSIFLTAKSLLMIKLLPFCFTNLHFGINFEMFLHFLCYPSSEFTFLVCSLISPWYSGASGCFMILDGHTYSKAKPSHFDWKFCGSPVLAGTIVNSFKIGLNDDWSYGAQILMNISISSEKKFSSLLTLASSDLCCLRKRFWDQAIVYTVA